MSTPDGSAALDQVEIDRLAEYNAEVYRGLVHTDEYREQMAALQARFDATRTISTLPRRRGLLVRR